jgi:hypothetical protein
MSESQPHDLDDFDRALLGSARADDPDKGAVLRAAAALGVGLSAAAPSVAAASATGTAARLLSLSGYKWTLIGAIGVAGAGTGTVAYLGSAAPEARHADAAVAGGPRAKDRTVASKERAVRPVEKVPPPPEQTPESDGPSATKSSAVDAPSRPHADAPVGSRTSGAPTSVPDQARSAAPGGPTAASGVSIAEEVAAVDLARHTLRQGRAGEAFDQLNRYQERWPNGVLATEVVVLRVEAQLRLGRREAAKRDARAFIQTQPSSRYAARLRELFEPGELD